MRQLIRPFLLMAENSSLKNGLLKMVQIIHGLGSQARTGIMLKTRVLVSSCSKRSGRDGWKGCNVPSCGVP